MAPVRRLAVEHGKRNWRDAVLKTLALSPVRGVSWESRFGGVTRPVPAVRSIHFVGGGNPMFLEEFLRQKGRLVHSIEPQASLDDVVQKLVRHNCGSLVVCDPGDGPDCTRMVGIITERDILRACAAR